MVSKISKQMFITRTFLTRLPPSVLWIMNLLINLIGRTKGNRDFLSPWCPFKTKKSDQQTGILVRWMLRSNSSILNSSFIDFKRRASSNNQGSWIVESRKGLLQKGTRNGQQLTLATWEISTKASTGSSSLSFFFTDKSAAWAVSRYHNLHPMIFFHPSKRFRRIVL